MLPNSDRFTTRFDELLRARQEIAENGFDQWLHTPSEGEVQGPETEQQILEAQWAEDDLHARLTTGRAISIAAVIFVMPIIANFVNGVATPLVFWAVINIPLLNLAMVTWRRRELRFGQRRPVKGRKARIVAIVIVLLSLSSFVVSMARAV